MSTPSAEMRALVGLLADKGLVTRDEFSRRFARVEAAEAEENRRMYSVNGLPEPQKQREPDR